MRLLHLADLHLGKSIGNYSLIEDQEYCLNQIIEIIDNYKVEAIMIAGDIFDTGISSVDALKLYSDFIDELVIKRNLRVLAISGNHDSAQRLDVHNNFYKAQNYHLYGGYKDEVISLEDNYGKIHFHLVPFMTINEASIIFDREVNNFTEVYKNVLKDKTYEDRNVLITHCYANSVAIEDEFAYNEGQKPLTIGGSDAMDAHLFLDFDYVALGHLHNKHYVLDEKICYAGTFMKYSFDDVGNKSVTIVDITDKVKITEVPIKPLRDFRTITGKFTDIIKEDSTDDYLKIILEDETTIENAMAKLKSKFPHVVQIVYANRGVFESTSEINVDLTDRSPLELFEEFYKFKMDQEMDEQELEAIKRVIE